MFPGTPDNLGLDRLSGLERGQLLFSAVTGSHAYGTQTETSDVDIRGIHAVPAQAYLALQAPPEQVADERNDITYYSLRRFIWDSCACDEEHEDEITLGGQLNVGTVFSRALPTSNSSSQTFTLYDVEVWAKIRVDDLNRLDSIYMVVSDDSGNSNSSGDRIADFTNNTWHVIRHAVSNPQDWDDINLRATVSLLGTTNTARVGRVKVDIEWFAFGLTAV